MKGEVNRGLCSVVEFAECLCLCCALFCFWLQAWRREEGGIATRHVRGAADDLVASISRYVNSWDLGCLSQND